MKHSKTPSIKNLKQKLYTDSPYNLGSVNDSAFGTGVNYALENEVIVKAVNSHDDLVEALKMYTEKKTPLRGGRRCGMKYGDKRDYPKIDIFVNGEYECSTTWAKTCEEAVKRYVDKFRGIRGKVTAHRQV